MDYIWTLFHQQVANSWKKKKIRKNIYIYMATRLQYNDRPNPEKEKNYLWQHSERTKHRI